MSEDSAGPKVVYDEDYVAELPRFVRGCKNPWPVAVCKSPDASTRKLRSQIEDWYQLISTSERTRFYGRLRSYEGPLFVSALAELYVHQWIRSTLEPVGIAYEPPVGQGCPDFVVSLRSGDNAVLEVYSAHDVGDRAETERVESEFFRQCDKWLPEGYSLWIDFKPIPTTNEEVSAVVRCLREILEAEMPDAKTELPLDKGDVRGRVIVLAAGRSGRTDVSGWGSEVVNVSAIHDHINERLQEKASKFRDGLTDPLILVVVDETGWAMQEDSWLDICYGDIPYRKGSSRVFLGKEDGDKTEVVALPRKGGLFIRHERGQPRSTYISAVIAGRHRWSDDGLQIAFTGFANPFADRLVPGMLLNAVPFWVPDSRKTGELMRREPEDRRV